VSDFITIGIHTKPSDAVNEISNLVGVYEDASKRLGIDNAMFMGDFNAGCNYVTSFDEIELASDNRFYWLIGNNADTTTKNTDCPYDRIVLAGTDMLNAAVVGSTTVFNFGKEYKLDQDEVRVFTGCSEKKYL